jgi:histidyl-tRNA synthetase
MLGQDELAAEVVTVKDLASGEQISLAQAEAADYLLKHTIT